MLASERAATEKVFEVRLLFRMNGPQRRWMLSAGEWACLPRVCLEMPLWPSKKPQRRCDSPTRRAARNRHTAGSFNWAGSTQKGRRGSRQFRQSAASRTAAATYSAFFQAAPLVTHSHTQKSRTTHRKKQADFLRRVTSAGSPECTCLFHVTFFASTEVLPFFIFLFSFSYLAYRALLCPPPLVLTP